jgi:hypothetical protein
MITKDELRTLREKTVKGKTNEASIIPSGELERIRLSMMTHDPVKETKKAAQDRAMMEAAARIKKEKL